MNNNIEGNIIADLIVSMFLWPQTLVQLEKELTEKNNTPTDDEDNSNTADGDEKAKVEEKLAA